MEKKITKKQTMSLLRMVQKFQYETCGKYNISINVYHKDGGGKRNTIWFTCDANVGDNTFINGRCYEWDTYENNLENLTHFMEILKG